MEGAYDWAHLYQIAFDDATKIIKTQQRIANNPNNEENPLED
jgi:hypothetical protein